MLHVADPQRLEGHESEKAEGYHVRFYAQACDDFTAEGDVNE